MGLFIILVLRPQGMDPRRIGDIVCCSLDPIYSGLYFSKKGISLLQSAAIFESILKSINRLANPGPTAFPGAISILEMKGMEEEREIPDSPPRE
jgi:hypothetical protein